MEDAQHLAAEIGTLLVDLEWDLAVAESCTGGLIGHLITNVPGSSGYFVGGILSYANRIKRDTLGVPEALIMAHGAVSEQVVLAMARGVRVKLAADVGVSVTGIAGPTGGTATKPVGTVFVAVAWPGGEEARHYLWNADRITNKALSAAAALDLLREALIRARQERH